MLTDLLFFLIAGATLTLLVWTGTELFRNQEDPLGDRLEALQSQAMVVAARAERRKRAGRGLDRFLYLVGLFPGGDDWMRGTEKPAPRAGTASAAVASAVAPRSAKSAAQSPQLPSSSKACARSRSSTSPPNRRTISISSCLEWVAAVRSITILRRPQPRKSSLCGASALRSARRPRWIRDFTVPTSTRIIVAISA